MSCTDVMRAFFYGVAATVGAVAVLGGVAVILAKVRVSFFQKRTPDAPKPKE